MVKYIKMFIAGIALPSTVLPFLLLIASTLGKTQVLNILFLHFIPIIWGVWNILHTEFFLKILPKNPTWGFLISGAVLGFLVAAIGVFGLDLPQYLGFPKAFMYLPLLGAPLVYALLWLVVVYPLNRVLGVY